MKIVITGSLGHISKPLTVALLQSGHSVTVISSNPAKQTEIESLGAKAAIGSVEDVAFLTGSFSGADAVYCMIPGGDSFFDQSFDVYAHAKKLATNFKTAIQQTGIKKVIHLSSIGAHTDKNNGLLLFHFQAEQILRELAEDVAIKHIRPVGFYYNMLAFIPLIKHQGFISTNYNASYKEPWVSPLDIAAVVAEEFETPFTGRAVRYVASDEMTSNEIAHLLGTAIGNPALQWIAVPDEEQLKRMLLIGMNAQIAKGLVEMNAARHTGELFDDYYLNKPELGPTKLTDFATQFAAAYNQK